MLAMLLAVAACRAESPSSALESALTDTELSIGPDFHTRWCKDWWPIPGLLRRAILLYRELSAPAGSLLVVRGTSRTPNPGDSADPIQVDRTCGRFAAPGVEHVEVGSNDVF